MLPTLARLQLHSSGQRVPSKAQLRDSHLLQHLLGLLTPQGLWLKAWPSPSAALGPQGSVQARTQGKLPLAPLLLVNLSVPPSLWKVSLLLEPLKIYSWP